MARFCAVSPSRALSDGDVTPLEAVCIIKALDEDGDDSWYVRCTEGIDDLELMGALMIELDRRRYHKAISFLTQDDDSDS